MLQNFRPREGGASGDRTTFGNYPLVGEVFVDGANPASDTQVFFYTCQAPGRVRNLGVELVSPRTAGTLTFQLKKNGVAVAGIVVTINNSNPTRAEIAADVACVDNDRLTVHMTNTGYAPATNAGKITLLMS